MLFISISFWYTRGTVRAFTRRRMPSYSVHNDTAGCCDHSRFPMRLFTTDFSRCLTFDFHILQSRHKLGVDRFYWFGFGRVKYPNGFQHGLTPRQLLLFMCAEYTVFNTMNFVTNKCSRAYLFGCLLFIQFLYLMHILMAKSPTNRARARARKHKYIDYKLLTVIVGNSYICSKTKHTYSIMKY